MPTTTKLVGGAPNQVPRNKDLGNLAYQDAQNIAGPVGVGGPLTVVGSTTLAAASMTAAAVTGAVEAGGGVVAEQLLADNFAASSSAVLRGGATNLLTYSEQFDNAAWLKTRATIAANAAVAPNGTTTADKLVEDTTASNTHFVRSDTAVVSGLSYTYSFFASAAERSEIVLAFGTDNSAFPDTQARFALTGNGTATIVAGTPAATITALGNGWYRCTATATATATATGVVRLSLAVGGINTYTGNGTSGVFIWGAQLNTGSVPAPYLQTIANAVTTAYAAPIESPNGLAFPLLSAMSPARNADMTFELASNTSLVVKVRGSDGIVRSATLTLA